MCKKQHFSLNSDKSAKNLCGKRPNNKKGATRHKDFLRLPPNENHAEHVNVMRLPLP